MADSVNHPEHYEKTCSLECIQVMRLIFGDEAVACFCMVNAFKYMWRYKNKNGQEDLDKAEWYLNYLGALDETENGEYIMSATMWSIYRRLVNLLNKESKKLKEAQD